MIRTSGKHLEEIALAVKKEFLAQFFIEFVMNLEEDKGFPLIFQFQLPSSSIMIVKKWLEKLWFRVHKDITSDFSDIGYL